MSRHAHAPQAVRIIGGQWKRTPLPVDDRPGLRPTPARLRETLFNWLGQDLTGWRCLDAFAGTGALGLEAASRGAAHVALVERDPALVARLQTLVNRLGAGDRVQVTRGDALLALRAQAPGSLDLVLLDPPFDAALFDAALAAAAPALAPGGLIYLEAPETWTAGRLAAARPPVDSLSIARHTRAGAVHGHLLQRTA